MKKRLCGILLVLAMILCQMPQAAIAAEAGTSAEPAVAAAEEAEDEAAEENVTEDAAEENVAKEAAPETSFFGVLISDVEGSMNTGGSYYMDYPGMEGPPSRTNASNNFVEDGSGVYIEAYPADGYKFVGWYQGDPDRAEGKLYVGEPLTTDRTYQFDAPISLTRSYICAVFDVDDSPQGDQVMM